MDFTRLARRARSRLLLAGAICVAAGAAASAQSFEMKDQRRVTLKFDKPVARVVGIPFPSATGIITVDGGPSRLVGMHPSAKSAIEEGPLKTIFPQTMSIASDITAQGFMPNVESLLVLRPDAVVQWANQGPDLLAAVERTGLKTLGMVYGTEETVRDSLTMYGDLLGKPARAKEIIAYRDEMQKRVAAAIKDVKDSDKPKVMHLQRALGLFQVAGSATYQGGNIVLAGGRNVAGDLKEFTTVNPEQIVAWAPDIILLNSFEAKLFPKDIYDNPLFAGIPAVKNKRVYKLPLGGYRWDPPSQESPLTWLWQASLYHPSLVKDDLRAEMTRAYQLFYNHKLTDAEIDGVLFLAQHPDAAGYERFRKR